MWYLLKTLTQQVFDLQDSCLNYPIAFHRHSLRFFKGEVTMFFPIIISTSTVWFLKPQCITVINLVLLTTCKHITLMCFLRPVL